MAKFAIVQLKITNKSKYEKKELHLLLLQQLF